MRKQRAFTLIELLVVIAIIAVLISILMPALGKAREQANFAICKTRIKNYGIMAFMYIHDNGEVFPDSRLSVFNEKTYAYETTVGATYRCRFHNPYVNLELHPELAGPFWSYIGSTKAMLCPTSARILSGLSGSFHYDHTLLQDIVPQYSYSMNGYLGRQSPDGVYKLTDIATAATTVFFTEEDPFNPNWFGATETARLRSLNDTALFGSGTVNGIQTAWETSKNNGNLDSLYHPGNFIDSFGSFHIAPDEELYYGVANAAFVDGHVEEVSWEDSAFFTIPYR